MFVLARYCSDALRNSAALPIYSSISAHPPPHPVRLLVLLFSAHFVSRCPAKGGVIFCVSRVVNTFVERPQSRSQVPTAGPVMGMHRRVSSGAFWSHNIFAL